MAFSLTVDGWLEDDPVSPGGDILRLGYGGVIAAELGAEGWTLPEFRSPGLSSAGRLVAEMPHPTLLPDAVRLVKQRTDYFEFAAYLPIGTNGIDWARLLILNRLNTGNTGAARLVRATLAKLNAAAVEAPNAANISTGTQGQAPDASVGTAGSAARTGTWTASATVGGVTDIRYSTAVGDYVEYTITGVTRIVLRHYGNSTVGGVAVMSVKTGGNEIADSFFRTRPGKLVDCRLAVGFLFSPIADGLDPAATYTVRMTVDASNPGSGRVYDGGLVGYNGVDFNAVGINGTAQTQSLGSPAVTTTAFLVAGAISVYELTDATAVQWRPVTNSAFGQVAFRVYDATGAEIDAGDYTVTTYDGYAASSVLQTVEVASGLPKGTYYLHVELLNTKNASSTNYRMYDYGAIGVDETAAGDPATGTFNDLGVVANTSSPAAITLQGTGNAEHAMRIRKPANAPGVEEDFAGGTHDNERAPTDIVVTVDGSTVDYAGAAAGDVWNGAEIEITFNTILEFPSSADAFATLNHRLVLSREGYRHDITRTMTADALVTDEYVMMVQAPKPGASEGAYGGGFEASAVSPGWDIEYATADNDSSLTFDRGDVVDVVLFNDAALVHDRLLNKAEIDAAFAAIPGSGAIGFLQDRSDGASKVYLRAKSFTPTDGSLIPSGHTYTAERIMRFALRG